MGGPPGSGQPAQGQLSPQQLQALALAADKAGSTPALGLLVASVTSAGAGPVLGVALGALADALTGNVAAARTLSQSDVTLANSVATALGLKPLTAPINALGAVQTAGIVGVAKVAQSAVNKIKHLL